MAVSITSSNEIPQSAELNVHLKIAVPLTPVTVVAGPVGLVIVAVPDTTDHTPEPCVGVLPLTVNVLEQLVWSVPAFAINGDTVVGIGLKENSVAAT